MQGDILVAQCLTRQGSWVSAGLVGGCQGPVSNDNGKLVCGGGTGGNQCPGGALCMCINGNICKSGLTCVNGTCYPCGGWSQMCCQGNTCSRGYTCQPSDATHGPGSMTCF
jgi:hypothetical protein